MHRLTVSALATLVLSGCVGGSPFDGPDPDFIRNGSDDPGDPAVVSLVTGGSFFCSGSLVSPRVVLTAAHCVAAVPTAATQVFFGTVVGGPGRTIQVTEAAMHPQFDPSVLSPFDIAVMALAEPVTDVAPIALNTTPVTEGLVGFPVRLVGFGNTELGNGSGGSKRQGQTVLSAFDANAVWYVDAPSGICFGDSGGPTLVDFGGGEVQLGVHWAVGGGDRGSGTCAPPNFDTRVDSYLDFVVAFIAGHSEPPPSEPPPPPPVEPPAPPSEPPPPQPSACDGVPTIGACEGNVLVYCDEGIAYRVDCGEWEQTCGYRAEHGEYDCNR
jgi:hypothetical protein